MPRLPLTETQGRLLEALRALGGAGTVGDLAQRAGVAEAVVRDAILAALSHVGGRVAVDARGSLRYAIDQTRPVPSFSPPWPARLAHALWNAFKFIFFAALSVTLVGYFVVYIVILIALLVLGIAAAAGGGDCDVSCDGCDGCGKCCDGCGKCCDGCSGCGDVSCNQAGDAVHAKTVGRASPEKVAARQHRRKDQKDRREARVTRAQGRARARRARLRALLSRLSGSARATDDGIAVPLEDDEVTVKPPFLRAVRDFVFGPLREPPSDASERQNLMGFLRDHGGRITATDGALLTGLARADADRLLLELTVALGGDVEVTDDGAIVYVFNDFVVSAGADVHSLAWLDAFPGGRVTVRAFATARGLSTADALSRLEHLRELSGARLEHGAETAFVFDDAARARLAKAGATHQGLRDYRFAWERLETSPAIIGVPIGERGWIWGFNALNLIVSLLLMAWYDGGERLVGLVFDGLSLETERLALGVIPGALSLGVYLIPLGRLIVETVRDFGRRRRNARRLVLLVLAERLLEGDPRVCPEQLMSPLDLPEGAGPTAERWLDRLARELDAPPDAEDPTAWDFSLVARELRAVELHAEGFREAGLAATVYDSGRPEDDLPE